jgi:hypothetical protein
MTKSDKVVLFIVSLNTLMLGGMLVGAWQVWKIVEPLVSQVQETLVQVQSSLASVDRALAETQSLRDFMSAAEL